MPEQTPGNGELRQLDAALRYANRGIAVFPCWEYDETVAEFNARRADAAPEDAINMKIGKGKAPRVHRGFHAATTNPDRIRAWWTRWPDAAIGMPTGAANETVVIDIDLPGGPENFDALRTQHGFAIPENTISSRTGGGGQQLFFYHPKDHPVQLGSSVSKLAPKVDVRANNGYIILPPSRHPSGNNYAWENGTDLEPFLLQPIPPALLELLQRASTAAAAAEGGPATDPECALDTPAVIAWAEHYLEHEAPVPSEGERNITLYKLACRLKERGVSLPRLQEAVLMIWNPRLATPLDEDELTTTCQSAWKTSQNKPGSLSVERFDSFDDPDAQIPGGPGTPVKAEDLQKPDHPGWIPEAAFAAKYDRAPKKGALCGFMADEINPEEIPARQWVLRGRYLKGYITVTVAPPATGKSQLSIAEALAIVSGRDDICGAVPRPGNVLLYNAEDPNDEMKGRITGAAAHHNIDLCACAGKLHVLTGEDRFLLLAREADNGTVLINEALFLEIIAYVKEHHITLVTLDPFVRLHRCNENSNTQMDAVAKVLTTLARMADCAVHIVHHTSKAASVNRSESLSAGRGATAIEAAARIGHNLLTMSDKDAELYNLHPDEAPKYMRVVNSKISLEAKSGDRWFKRLPWKLPCGDTVGVIETVVLQGVKDGGRERKGAAEILDAVKQLVPPGTRMGVNKLAEEIRKHPDVEFVFSKELPSRQAIRRWLLDDFFRAERELDGVSYIQEIEQKSERTVAYIRATRAPT